MKCWCITDVLDPKNADFTRLCMHWLRLRTYTCHIKAEFGHRFTAKRSTVWMQIQSKERIAFMFLFENIHSTTLTHSCCLKKHTIHYDYIIFILSGMGKCHVNGNAMWNIAGINHLTAVDWYITQLFFCLRNKHASYLRVWSAWALEGPSAYACY